MSEVQALLLAAGSGSRFGGDKLLAPIRGRPLVDYVASTLGAAIAGGVLAGGVAVVPAGAGTLAKPLAAAGLGLVENPEAIEGVATSLQRGLAALDEVPRIGGALIVLADQPGLSLGVISAVVAAWRRDGRTTRPRYAGAPDEPGHPVLLDRADWHLAARLSGDQGLRHLLARTAVTLVDVAGNNPDVDTPADLRRFEDQR